MIDEAVDIRHCKCGYPFFSDMVYSYKLSLASGNMDLPKILTCNNQFHFFVGVKKDGDRAWIYEDAKRDPMDDKRIEKCPAWSPEKKVKGD